MHAWITLHRKCVSCVRVLHARKTERNTCTLLVPTIVSSEHGERIERGALIYMQTGPPMYTYCYRCGGMRAVARLDTCRVSIEARLGGVALGLVSRVPDTVGHRKGYC